jgi:hypothetical protein
MLATLKARVAGNALELARSGTPVAPFYITGQVNGKAFSVHAEGERLFMLGEDGQRTEIDLATARQIAGPPVNEPPAKTELPEPVTAHGLVNADLQHESELPPGVSALDEGLEQLKQSMSDDAGESINDQPPMNNDSGNSPIPQGGDL